MTDRNELERLLAAATEGPWETATERGDNCRADWIWIAPADWSARVARVVSYSGREDQQRANAALIVWLRNNAQHYLSLMDEMEMLKRQNDAECFAMGEEIERLREAMQDILADVQVAVDVNVGAYEDPTSEQLISRAKRIARQALGETHDR